MIPKIMSSSKFICICLLVLIPLLGCAEKRLPGMPNLTPVQVTVTQDGKPLADATVTLLGGDPDIMKWPAGGVTDANGVANIRTGGRFDGAAVGHFKVMVGKRETPVNPLEEHASSDSARYAEYLKEDAKVRANTFDVVDLKFSSGATPLAIEVTKGEKNYSVDVSPAVKIKPVAANY